MRYIQPTHVLSWAVWTKRIPQTNSSILYPTVAFQHTWLVFHVALCFHFPQEKRFTGFQDICCKDEESLDQLIQNHTVLLKEYLTWMKSLANIYSINIGWMGENSACTWVAVLTLLLQNWSKIKQDHWGNDDDSLRNIGRPWLPGFSPSSPVAGTATSTSDLCPDHGPWWSLRHVIHLHQMDSVLEPDPSLLPPRILI